MTRSEAQSNIPHADRPCLEKECRCCKWWLQQTGIDKMSCTNNVKEVSEIISKKQEKSDRLVIENTSLTKDNKKYQKANQELRAKKNGIKAVTVADKSGNKDKPRGRPKGQKATINRRPEHIDREETIDDPCCPDCGAKMSETITSQYDRVATIVQTIRENVLFNMKRRWCSKCKKQKSQPIPGVDKYARRSSSHTAAIASLNLSGMSHGRTAEHSKDIMGVGISRAAAYRDKMSLAKKCAPMRDSIREDILKEQNLRCDEFWWPINGKQGYVLVALGKNSCLMEVSETRKIDALKKFLPGYKGTSSHDSYPGWLHMGLNHQMCMAHQIRLPKKEIKYGNPKGDVLKFLNELEHLCKQHYTADKITDMHSRKVAANCLDSQMRQLMNAEWTDDDNGTIRRFQKRWRREGYYTTTFLTMEGVEPDNNGVERMNRRFVSIRHDGGGNRSATGMEANSTLFTILATSKIQNTVFYDILQNSYSPG